MEEYKNARLSRREFMRLAAIVAGAAAVSGTAFVACEKSTSYSRAETDLPRLNPAFRIKKISDQEIELFTHMSNNELLRHRFAGLEADLFQEIDRERNIGSMISILAQKHGLTAAKCREKIMHSLHEFEGARLVYFGDKMIVKLVEIVNE